MKTVSTSELRRRCASVLHEIGRDRVPVLITKNGIPIAKLVPVHKKGTDLIGRLEGVISIVGDIETPIEPPQARESARR